MAKLIKEELSAILRKEIELENALITINDVDVYKDLLNARVKLGILPADKADEALKIIEKRAGYLTGLLLKKINIKPMPHLSFEIDRGAEAAADFDKAFLKSKNE